MPYKNPTIAKAYANRYYQKNKVKMKACAHEHYLAQRDNPEIKELRKIEAANYRKQNREKFNQRARERYHILSVVVKKARHAIFIGVRSGKLKKSNKCEVCGEKGKLHGHHDDYSKPYEVRWLCESCHGGTRRSVL
jgi:hypothetical protein